MFWESYGMVTASRGRLPVILVLAGGFWGVYILIDSKLTAVVASVQSLTATTTGQTKELEARGREIEDLKRDVRDLRSQLDTMRNMREAYVYSGSRRQQQPVTP